MRPLKWRKKNKEYLAKFKRIVRRVILCSMLLKEADEKIGTNPQRNVIYLTRMKRNTSLLTTFEKLLFEKPLANRSVKDRLEIVRIVANLKCLQIIPPKVRARVAPHFHYALITRDRLIMREHSSPVYAYVLLSGEVVASEMIEDANTKKAYRKDRFIVSTGDMMGHTTMTGRRWYSYRAVTDAECLFMDFDLFEEHVGPYIRHHIEMKYSALQMYDTLNTFTTTQKYFVALFGKLKEYQPMETIYCKDRGDLNYVYFVLNGECMILQHLKTEVTQNQFNQKRYRLCTSKRSSTTEELRREETLAMLRHLEQQSLATNSLNPLPTLSKISHLNYIASLEHHFIDVGTLGFGAIFGLGEPMHDRAIMARTIVQCLLIPRFWLMSRPQNPGNVWQRFKICLKAAIPSRKKLFADFLIDRKWSNVKRDYLQQQLQPNKMLINSTKIEDIPTLCRVVEHNLQDDSDEDYNDSWEDFASNDV